MLNGTGGAITFPVTVPLPYCLFNPKSCVDGLTISLWIKFYSQENNNGKQVFFSTLTDSNDRGFVIFQLNSSFNHIAARVIHGKSKCTKIIQAPKGIWTHLTVLYYKGIDMPEVHVNGRKSTSVIWQGCVAGDYPDVKNRFFTVGQNDIGAPNASIDDIVVILNAKTDAESLYNMYKYYEGNVGFG